MENEEPIRIERFFYVLRKRADTPRKAYIEPCLLDHRIEEGKLWFVNVDDRRYSWATTNKHAVMTWLILRQKS